MTDDILDDEELQAPGRKDFRRVGRGTPYVIGLDGKRTRYGRFSNAGKILDDESNLTNWKLRTSIIGAAQRPDLMASVSVLNPVADKNAIRDIVEECLVSGKGQERAVKGTAIHSMFDRIDRGDEWEPAPQWLDLCNSYKELLKAWGLEPVDMECHCINDEFRLAGSMDRRYKTSKVLVAPDATTVPIGSMVAADTKTGQVLEYASGSYATQLAGYAHSLRYDVETDERSEFNPPTFPDWGLIIHADSGGTKVQVYWVDLNAGLDGLRLAQQVKQWRTRSDLLTLGPEPVLLAPQLAPEAPVARSQAPDALGLLEHTRGRVLAILAHSEIAGKALARIWPPGIPGLKAGGHSWDDLQQVIDAVEQIEKDYSVPFYPPFEPVAASMQRHPSNQWTVPEVNPQLLVLSKWCQRNIDPDVREALKVFASIDTTGWPTTLQTIDEQLTVYLDGTLRALGFIDGIEELGAVTVYHCSQIVSAAIAITSGTGQLVYGPDDKPVFRTNIVRG